MTRGGLKKQRPRSVARTKTNGEVREKELVRGSEKRTKGEKKGI